MAIEMTKQERIVEKHGLDIPGLIFRGFQGESDYPKMLDLINASKVADQVERSDTLEEIKRAYAHLNHSDPYQDMVFAEIDGRTIAYGRVEWNISDDGEWLGFLLAFLHPDWRRKGIGTALLRNQESRLRLIADQQMDKGKLSENTPCYFETFSTETEVGKEALLKKEGYFAVRHFYSMVRPLSEPVDITLMPEGLEIRTVRRDQFRMLWDANQEAFKDHWGFVPASENDYLRWEKDPLHDPNLWRVAWDGDQIAGMVLNFLNKDENEEYKRQRGYTEDICVRRPWRKRGLARALLSRSLQMFKDMGMDHGALGVDTQNLSGALNLYKSVGFQVEKRHTNFRKEF